jgi:thiamine pyrophosphate-dependent acetolactate synthase large subunit-like protein
MATELHTRDCFDLLAKRWRNELVVCTLGTVTSEWHARTQSDKAFHMHAMGIAASFALGLALALSNTPVWLLDSDGGLTMSLGSLIAEGRHKPKNLVHFVLNNGTYQIIGGYPVVSQERIDFTSIARGAGFDHAERFDNLATFESELDGLLTAGAHRFAVLDVVAEPPPKAPVPFEGAEIKYRFGRHIEQQEGVAVFGPYGY